MHMRRTRVVSDALPANRKIAVITSPLSNRARNASPSTMARFKRALPAWPRALFAALAIVVTAASGTVAAQSAVPDESTSRVAAANDTTTRSPASAARDFSADIEARKKYGVPALEILGFDLLVNLVNRYGSGSDDYGVFRRTGGDFCSLVRG